MLSCRQTRIVSSDAKQKKAAMELSNPDRFRDKYESGIDFIASGNEPFWSLEIDFDKSIHFKSLNGIDIMIPAGKGEKAMDADVTRYAGETDSGSLIIQLGKWECVNDMSGEKMPYSVTVDVKKKSANNYVTYKGCGRNLFDYRLNDIWVLDSINNKKITSKDFVKELPRFEFLLTDMKCYGYTGCNNLNTSIKLMGNKITFGKIITTKMACAGFDESLYLQYFDNKTLEYKIANLKLYLQSANDLLVYRKVD